MSISWEDSELRKLSADLGDANNKVGKQVADVVRKHGQALQQRTQQLSPVDTGELRGSWALSTSGDGRSSGMTAEVKSNVRQSFFQEYGTSKMAAQPSAGPALESIGPQFVADMQRAGSEFLQVSAVDVYEAIAARLSTPSIVVRDEIQQTPSRPYYLVQVRPGAPQGRRLTHDADTLPVTVWVMAVNNSPAGCTFLVERAIGLLDNFPLTPANRATVTFTGPVVEDDGPGDWRWSQGVEVRVFNPKEY